MAEERLPSPPPEAFLPKPPPEALRPVTPSRPTQQDVVRWLAALPGTPEGQRERAAIAKQYGSGVMEGEIERRDPASAWAGRHIMPMLPYAALGAVPADWPFLAAATTRGAGAFGIGAAQAQPGQSRIREGVKALLGQTAGEIVAPPVTMFAARLGSRAYNRLSDHLVDRLMAGAKKLVPWWNDLPAGQAGFTKLMQDEGVATLRRQYGEAFRKAIGTALKGERLPLTAEDAAYLNLAPKSGTFPAGTVLVDADEALLRANLKGASEIGAAVQQRVLESVGQLREVLAATKPEAATRIANAISGEVLAAEKGYYREGMNLIQALRTLKALDPAGKRLDPENLIKGLAIARGASPQTVWERFLTETKAPGARELLQDMQRRLPRAPERVPLPWFRERLGTLALGERSPFAVGYRHVPWTPAETETIHSLAPVVAGSMARGVGDVMFPSGAVKVPPVAPKEGTK